MCGRMLAAALLLLPGTAFAQPLPCPSPPATIPFAPPLNVPMLLTARTERPISSGGSQRFALTFRLHFADAGRGLRLTSTLLQIDAPGAGGAGVAMEKLLSPLVGRPMDFLLSKDGRNLMLHDGDALWAAVERDLIEHSDQAPVAEGRQLAQLLLRLPSASREQLFAADIRNMLRFAELSWAQQFMTRPGLSDGNCGLVTFVEHSSTDADTAVTTSRSTWQVDIATGLVTEQNSEEWQASATGDTHQLVARTHRTLAPER